MANIPVFSVWGAAMYASLLRYPTAFRLAWFPLIMSGMLGVARDLSALHVEQANAAGVWTPILGGAFDPVVIALAGINPLVWVGLWLFAAVSASVALYRWALTGEDRAGHYFNFDWGWTQTLSFVAAIFWLVLFGVLIFVYVMGFQSIVPPSDWTAYEAMAQRNGNVTIYPAEALLVFAWYVKAYAIIGFAVIVWSMLRLSLWQAAIVESSKFALGAARDATRGQTVRLFFVTVFSIVFAFVVTTIVMIIALSIVGGPGLRVSETDGHAVTRVAENVALPENPGTALQWAGGVVTSATGMQSVALDPQIRRNEQADHVDPGSMPAWTALRPGAAGPANPLQFQRASVLAPVLTIFWMTVFAWAFGRAYRARVGG